jgi:hypothetical protein
MKPVSLGFPRRWVFFVLAVLGMIAVAVFTESCN